MSGSASIACILPLTLSSMRLATSSSLGVVPGQMPVLPYILADNAPHPHGPQGHGREIAFSAQRNTPSRVPGLTRDRSILRVWNDPGSAVQHSASLHAAPRPGKVSGRGSGWSHLQAAAAVASFQQRTKIYGGGNACAASAC